MLDTSKNENEKFFDLFQEKGLSTQTFPFMYRRTPLNIRNIRVLFEWASTKKSTSNQNQIFLILYTFSNQFDDILTRTRLSKYAMRNSVQRIINLILHSKGNQYISFPSTMTNKILLGAFKIFAKKNLRTLITINKTCDGETCIQPKQKTYDFFFENWSKLVLSFPNKLSKHDVGSSLVGIPSRR